MGPLSNNPQLPVTHGDPPQFTPTPYLHLPPAIALSKSMTTAGSVSSSGSAPEAVVALVSLMSAHEISVSWTATRDLLDELLEGTNCPLAEIMGDLSDGAARVRAHDTERAAPQASVAQLESEDVEWYREYRDIASVKRLSEADIGEE